MSKTPKGMPKGTAHIKNRAPGENPAIDKIRRDIAKPPPAPKK